MKRTNGILGRVQSSLKRNRLGELLVARGVLSPAQLKAALGQQSQDRKPLGQILLDTGIIKRRDIFSAILMQWTMRSMATVVTVMIAVSAFHVQPAAADSLRAMPAAFSAAALGPVASYPELFGSEEKKSGDLSAFTKWSTMFSRFDSEMSQSANEPVVKKWKADLETMRGLPLNAMIDRVNNMANAIHYIPDNKNWGKSDYWETPIEFFARGGDCEDFAIAKYASLRALGVPDSRLRVAIVKDMQKNVPHAILIVYTDKGPVILDNQIKSVEADTSIDHYKPIFSINRTSWWLHTPGSGTQIASR